MFNFLKKNHTTKGETLELKIEGMHCSSCGMAIDGELEDLDGVIEASTKYATAQSKIIYDPTKVSVEQIKDKVEEAGYQVK